MSYIETLTAWNASTVAWDSGDSQEALDKLRPIQEPCSKILFNFGCAQLALRNYTEAIKLFTQSMEKDEHMAVAYFQRGCVYFKAQRLQDAARDFQECQRRFRGKKVIDYTQLGLRHKLYLCEALHNAGVVQAHGSQRQDAEDSLKRALQGKVELRHRVIGESLKKVQAGERPNLIELPREAIYRPPKAKLDNIQKKDYLGKAQVISSIDQNDNFSGFTGPRMLEQGLPVKAIHRDRNHRPSVPAIFVHEVSGLTGADSRGRKMSSPGLFPPKDPGQTRRKSEGDLLNASHPPPPSRPPPKLGEKLLPELPRRRKSPILPRRDPVKVVFHCHGEHTVEVVFGTTLDSLLQIAATCCELDRNSFNLWIRNAQDGEMTRLNTENDMQAVWRQVSEPNLALWCYGRE